MEPEVTKKANEIRSSLLREINKRVELVADQTPAMRERLHSDLDFIEKMANVVNLLDPGNASLGLYSAGSQGFLDGK